MKEFLKQSWLAAVIVLMLGYLILFPRIVQLDVSQVALVQSAEQGSHYILSAKVSAGEGLLPDGRIRIVVSDVKPAVALMTVDEKGKNIPAPFEGIALIAKGKDVVAHFVDPLLLQAIEGDVIALDCQSGAREWFNCVMISPEFK